MIIKAGANVNVRTDFTPWQFYNFIGAMNGMTRDDYYAKPVGKGGYTALMFAASQNVVDAARVLIEAGGNVNAKTDHGTTALMEAAVCNATDVAKLLIRAGADVNAKDNDGGTVLSWAIGSDIEALLKAAGARR